MIQPSPTAESGSRSRREPGRPSGRPAFFALFGPIPRLVVRLVAVLALSIGALAVPAPTNAQSVLERTPNVSGGWVGRPGQLQFDFLHRFHLVEGGDESVVVNTPSFLLAAPLPGSTLLGLRYATSSSTTPGKENEWELLARWAALEAEDTSPVDLSLTGAYNTAASSLDGELQVGVPLGRVKLLGVGRAFSDQRGRGDPGWAAGGGAVLRVSDDLALAGDVVSASDLPESRAVAWGAGLQVRVPLTPHTLSLQATNTRTSTLLGSSEGFREVGPSDAHQIVWGFEFTIPITLSRYFGSGGGNRGAREGGARGVAPGGNDDDRGARSAAGSGGSRVGMTRDLRFTPAILRIEAGATVTWENTSPLVHTVTAVPDRADEAAGVSLPEGASPFHSAELEPGDVFTHTFNVPGRYVYFCEPHEEAGMIGTVVVTP